MNKLPIAAVMAAALALGACSTTQKVSVMQPGDQAMTCAGLRGEFAKLDEVKAQGERNQGVNGANVAAAVFFPLAIAGNYMNARDAMQLAEQRRTHLMTIYDSKRCDNPANASLSFMVPRSILEPGRGVSH